MDTWRRAERVTSFEAQGKKRREGGGRHFIAPDRNVSKPPLFANLSSLTSLEAQGVLPSHDRNWIARFDDSFRDGGFFRDRSKFVSGGLSERSWRKCAKRWCKNKVTLSDYLSSLFVHRWRFWEWKFFRDSSRMYRPNLKRG